MTTPTLTVAFPDGSCFLEAFDTEMAKAGLLVRGASLPADVQAMSACCLEVEIGDSQAAAVDARIAAIVPGVGVAVMFEGGVPQALSALASRLRAGDALAPEAASAPEGEDEGPATPGPLSERLKAMNVTQKMQLALSGSREERFALLRDPVKPLHVFVLKNPRIGLDEVAYAAKLPTLSPDALKLISESREWTGNATICIALVRNPRTPLPIALRMLERIPLSEIRALAKGGAREQIVHAARRKVNG